LIVLGEEIRLPTMCSMTHATLKSWPAAFGQFRAFEFWAEPGATTGISVWPAASGEAGIRSWAACWISPHCALAC